MMDLTETLIPRRGRDALGTTVVKIGDRDVDLEPPFRRAPMAELIEENARRRRCTPRCRSRRRAKIADRLRRRVAGRLGLGQDHGRGLRRDLRGEADRADVRHGPPARDLAAGPRAPRRPELTERFELVVAARELANAYSELNDPRRPARAASRTRRSCRPAATRRPSRSTRTTSRALEYGLPPTGGLGHRDRPAGDAAGRRGVDPRGDPLPDAAPAGGRRAPARTRRAGELPTRPRLRRRRPSG